MSVERQPLTGSQLRPVPLTAVTFEDAFWRPRRALLRAVSLPAQYAQCEATGRVQNLHRAAGWLDQPFQGRYYNDSDVYKWLEAVAWLAAEAPDVTLAQMADGVIAAVAAAQQPDGYVNSYFMFERAGERWQDLANKHELYCAGHLIEAAVAHYRATGRDNFLRVAIRLADHICDRFGPAGQAAVPGHEEIELALVALYRVTGNGTYLAQAQRFLDLRGRGLVGGRVYHQDHLPFRELPAPAGHAVRALYLNMAAADLLAETGEPALRAALERQWWQMTTRQMYLSGGVGARAGGEAFGGDYELPNGTAYAETCAAVANVLWQWRMLQLDGAARYADVLEQALYNGVLAGWSLDGLGYFYDNPLASDGRHRRQPWFECACCPPNLARLLAALPGYCYSTSAEGLWVHLYVAGRVTTPFGRLRLETNYPWAGELTFTWETVARPGRVTLFLRLPAWCAAEDVELVVGDGQRLAVADPALQVRPGTLALRRAWQPGEQVRLALPMLPRLVVAHPHVTSLTGRVALMRGPLLYCAEAVDNPGVDVRDVALRAAPAGMVAVASLPGMVGLRVPGVVTRPGAEWQGALYRAAAPARPGERYHLTAVPYFAWANRDPGRMQVWFRQADRGDWDKAD